MPLAHLHLPRIAGDYLVSPLTRMVHNGWFAASVSIRWGRGAARSERTLRMTRLFRDPVSAAGHAMAERLQWIGSPKPLPA
jgi:hypothetical protein